MLGDCGMEGLYMAGCLVTVEWMFYMAECVVTVEWMHLYMAGCLVTV